MGRREHKRGGIWRDELEVLVSASARLEVSGSRRAACVFVGPNNCLPLTSASDSEIKIRRRSRSTERRRMAAASPNLGPSCPAAVQRGHREVASRGPPPQHATRHSVRIGTRPIPPSSKRSCGSMTARTIGGWNAAPRMRLAGPVLRCGGRGVTNEPAAAPPHFLHRDSAALHLKLNEVVRVEPNTRDQ